MKIICSKAGLVKGVNIVSKAVPSRTTMPILECILIDASEGKIKLTANDMELGIETVVDGIVEEKGMIALNAKIFLDIARKLPDNEVIIETDGNLQTSIICEKAKFAISGKSGEDFSCLPFVEKEECITISQFSLKEVIRQTIFSISDNENNRLMTGELFHIYDNSMKIVSLDGHRISIRNIELKENYEEIKVVVPGKTLQEISRILPGESEESVDIFFTPNHILFEFNETRVVSRLIEGEYFHIEQMLSSDYETKIKINKKDLLNCIDRSTLLINEGDKRPVIMNIGDEIMKLKMDSFIGSMDDEIDIEKEGKDMMIAFNPRFFLDVLRVIDEETVSIYMVNTKAPCYIKDDRETFIYLILPVNFNVI